MKRKRVSFVTLFVLVLFALISCSENPIEVVEKPPCPPSQIVSIAPYDSPIWHPSDDIIGFNYTPLDSITYPYGGHCMGVQHFNYDSTGFWLIKSDGTNKRRVLPFKLQTPSWSNDGKWIAFVMGAQIYKMPFINGEFDTTNIVQLTTKGSNFFPTWSPDGKWIAYDQSICKNANSCGVLIMNKDGEDKRFISEYSRMPNWHPSGQRLTFINRAVLEGGEVIGDSLWEYDIINNKRKLIVQLTGTNYDNRYPKYSPKNNILAFSSNDNSGEPSQIWIIDLLNNDIKQLTYKGIADGFSWSPNGNKIVFTQNTKNWHANNGTLCIIDIHTSYEKQLTYNF